jgi:hypothetical protein
MGFLVEYTGGINAKDYKLVYLGSGNGFALKSHHCEIINHTEAREVKGVIELTLEHLTTGCITLGDADRFVMTAEDARDLINTLKDAIDEAEGYEEEIVEMELSKEQKVNV